MASGALSGSTESPYGLCSGTGPAPGVTPAIEGKRSKILIIIAFSCFYIYLFLLTYDTHSWQINF